MGTAAMGKVVVSATLQNLEDLFDAAKGVLPPDQVRTLDVSDALIDSGATMLLLPARHISQLGLREVRIRQAKAVGGSFQMKIYSAVRLTIQGRECTVDVGEIADDLPVIVGQLPLEAMDWVIDLKNQRLIGNPEHGGEQVIEVFGLGG